MLLRLQGKQNLWWLTEGHWTKCVSSSRSWHNVHFNVGFGVGADDGPVVLLPPPTPPPPTLADVGMPSMESGPLLTPPPPTPPPLPMLTGGSPPTDCWDCCASVEVTVVLDTWREPEERRPLDDPNMRWTKFILGLG